MSVVDGNSGRIALTDAFAVWPGMPRKKLAAGLEELTGKPCAADDPQRASVLMSGLFPLDGVNVSCVCSFHLGRLHSLELYPAAGAAREQRERLFSWIGAEDPCRETMRSVLSRFSFGTAWIGSDPLFGDAVLRITYDV